ncbi:MAG: cytochrome c, partial [Bacteroidota bacterium]|nr:cytochrome c [Bacteroidota bacterium]
MEFFDKLVLPHSGANLEFLKFLLAVALIIFSIFSGVLLASSFLSYIFLRKFRKSGRTNHWRLARDFADLITTNKVMGIFLGVVPFTAVIMIYLQLLHETGSEAAGYMIFGFFMYIFGLSLIYIYKNTLHLNYFFNIFSKYGKDEADPDTTRDLEEYSSNSRIANSNSSIWGLIFLFLSIWFFTAANALAVDSAHWADAKSIFVILFSGASIVNLLHFLTTSLSVAGAAFIVKYFYWDKRKYDDDNSDFREDNYKSYSMKFCTTITLSFSVLQPVFFAINSSQSVISYTSLGIIFTILVLMSILIPLLYNSLKKNKFGSITYAFYILLLIFAFITIREQSAFGTAIQGQILTLAAEYEKSEKEGISQAG